MNEKNAKTEVTAKLVEATAAILACIPRNTLNITVLNKALFYLDLLALRDLGHTATGATFVALERGPVVDQYKSQLLPALLRAGVAKQIENEESRPVVLTSRPGFKLLGEDVLALARRIADNVAAFSSRGVTDVAHRNPGWKAAWARGNGSPVNMLVAMQQILDEDPWLSDEPDDEVNAAFAKISAETLEAW